MDKVLETQVEDYKKPHIFVATPCYIGQVNVKYMESMLGLQQLFLKCGLGFSFYTIPFDSLIPRARNASVTRFLRHNEATHLLFIDADIQFSPESVFKMLKEDKDVIAGCYPKKALDFEAIKNNYAKTTSQLELIQSSVKYAFNFKHQKSHSMVRGVVEVLDAPTGFMMIKKSVIRRMIKQYPETEYKNDVSAYQVNPDDRFFDLFQSQVFDGRYLSEDYGFCRLWQNMKGCIFADLTVKLNHIGQFHYYGDPIMYMKYSNNIQMNPTNSEANQNEKLKLPPSDCRDTILDDMLSDKKAGIFVDIGTGDGTNGYTKKLESSNWSGLCIEGNPETFSNLKKNRKSVCVNRVLYNTSNVDVSEVYKTNESVKDDRKTMTLYEVLREQNIKHVDYLTIDTGGTEYEILEGLFSCTNNGIHVSSFDVRKSMVNKKFKKLIKDHFKFYKSADGYEYYVNKSN